MNKNIVDILGSKPYYLDFLAECVNNLLMYRTGGEYMLQDASYLDQRRREQEHNHKAAGDASKMVLPLDVAKSSFIPGNLAKVVLTCGDVSWGADWIAPSFQIKNKILKAVTSEDSQVVLTTENACIKVNSTRYINEGDPKVPTRRKISESVSFQPKFLADCDETENRTHDSEHLLLNYLDYLIEKKLITRNNNKQGFLSIVSERIPCSSCARNIRDFLSAHDWITLRLFYFYDTPNRGPKEFLAECTDHGMSAIEKIAISVHVHVVEVKANPSIVLSERVVEQQKMFGGAPNQILAAISSVDA